MSEFGDTQQSQFERTQLAWRRTLLVVLAVAGIGGVHLLVDQRHHEYLGVFTGLVGLVAVAPIALRLRRLRRYDGAAATWEPVVLTAVVLVLAIGLTVVS